ncbi:MAG: hypothetical protein ACRDGA_01390, partial [Bacteroidota bacterium]
MCEKNYSQNIFNESLARLLLSLLVVASMFAPTDLVAGKFGEHKKIGDEAFKRFVQRYQLQRLLGDSLNIIYARREPIRLFPYRETRDGSDILTYGDLTGLSADHGIDPFEIYYSLIFQRSTLSRTLEMQQTAIRDNKLAAEDFALTKIDLFYPLKAIVDKAHFYELGKNFEDQLAAFDEARLNQLDRFWGRTMSELEPFFHSLLEANALEKYAILHSIALEYMYIAGQLIDSEQVYMKRYALEYLERGLLFNAFADHYLQDMFAAGHLAVQRAISRALDNMGTHDYYCRNGLDVRNQRGDAWKTYGDGFIDSTTYHYAILANDESLNELWEKFLHGRESDSHPTMIEELRAHRSDLSGFLKNRFRAFTMVPIPFRQEEIAFANSRNGLVYAAFVSKSNERHVGTMAGGRVGFGFNMRAPRPADAGKESLLWGGLN